jgi:Raf kinase inhibitor-like YbhB/YbcL family protein
MAFQISSPAFGNNSPIPKRHTCDGENRSPELTWTGAPAETESFALICDDPDAPMGTWVHWVMFAIPATCAKLGEGVPAQAQMPDGAIQGINSWGKPGYGGPCPPRGKPHRYYFKLYALDAALSLSPQATKQTLLDALRGHVLAESQWMGTYGR